LPLLFADVDELISDPERRWRKCMVWVL